MTLLDSLKLTSQTQPMTGIEWNATGKPLPVLPGKAATAICHLSLTYMSRISFFTTYTPPTSAISALREVDLGVDAGLTPTSSATLALRGIHGYTVCKC